MSKGINISAINVPVITSKKCTNSITCAGMGCGNTTRSKKKIDSYVTPTPVIINSLAATQKTVHSPY